VVDATQLRDVEECIAAVVPPDAPAHAALPVDVEQAALARGPLKRAVKSEPGSAPWSGGATQSGGDHEPPQKRPRTSPVFQAKSPGPAASAAACSMPTSQAIAASPLEIVEDGGSAAQAELSLDGAQCSYVSQQARDALLTLRDQLTACAPNPHNDWRCCSLQKAAASGDKCSAAMALSDALTARMAWSVDAGLVWDTSSGFRDAWCAAAEHVIPSMSTATLSTLLGELIGVELPVQGELRTALSVAVERLCSSMGARDLSSALQVLARAAMPVEGGLRTALCTAAERVSSSMGAYDVSAALQALAALAVPVDGGLRTALLTAVERLSTSMDSQDVAYTVQALTALAGTPLKGTVRAALCEALARVHVGSYLRDKEVFSVLQCLATFALPAEGWGGLPSALIAAARHARMDAWDVPLVLWAAERLP
jgi:hypothetical protein